MKSSVEQLFQEAMDRVLKGEDPDPAMAMVAALCRGEKIPEAEAELILRAHQNGPWAIASDEDLTVFSRWCTAAGSPVQIGEPVEIAGVSVYRDNFGDCVLAEAARGYRFAVWTRKGRLQIGFRNEADALKFRATDRRFSMEETGNKRPALVVIEGGDNPEIIKVVSGALATL